MPDFTRNESVDLAPGMRLRSVDVAGRALEVRRAPAAGTPVRDAEPGTPGAAVADAGAPAPAAEVLGAAIADAGMRLDATVELQRLEPAPRRAARARAADAPRLELEVEAPAVDEEQVVLEVDDTGYVRWLLPEPIGPGGRRTRAGGRQRFVVPVDQRELAPPPGPSRRGGVFDFGIRKVLHVLRFPVQLVAGVSASKAVELWEGRFRPYGLTLANPDGSAGPDVRPDTLARLSDDGAFLLLVHGFLGRGASAFGGLVEDAALFRALHDRYGGRVLVFDHPTIHVAPQDNVRWLRERLPTDRQLRFDVLAHSRGGLVARQLVRQPVGPDPLVDSIIHVGVPNAGTPLAGNHRLGTLLDTFTNLLSLFPDTGSSIALEAVLEIVKQVAQGAFGGLAGIAAMDPANAELAALNAIPATGTVRAITTDYEPRIGESLAAKALDTVVDEVIDAGNDLVVPTEGVFKAGSYIVADPVVATAAAGAGPLNHNTYFRDGDVRARLADWLAPR